MRNRSIQNISRDIYAVDEIELNLIPYYLNKGHTQYEFIKEYPRFYLYKHYGDNYSFYECFDKFDIKILSRYGERIK